jgi:hypothetical protein
MRSVIEVETTQYNDQTPWPMNRNPGDVSMRRQLLTAVPVLLISFAPAVGMVAQSSPTVAEPTATAPAATAPAATAPAGETSPLDLNALIQQLRDTHAIGIFTKLSLKNQVDDLLSEFRTFYQGDSQFTLAELRRDYEVLLLKVVSVLQDGDPSLAQKVNASREAIWGVLSDPTKFAGM